MGPAAISAIVTAILIGGFYLLSEGNPPKYSENDNRLIVEYGWPARALSIAFTVVFAYAFTEIRSNQPEDTALQAMVLAFLAFSVYFAIEARVRRLEVDEDYLYVRSPWSKRRRISWEALRRVKWHPMMKAHSLRFDEERAVMVYDILSGAKTVVDHARRWEKFNQKQSGR